MIIKVNYTVSDIYMSTSVSAVYIKVVYSGVSAGGGGTVSSVGLTMPSAFGVANSPVTSSGTLAVTALGSASQYIRGDGVLATLPTGGSGGSSVSYYLNGGTAASVGTYFQMSTTPVVGANADFTRTGNGLISQFLTDVGDPNRLQIPAGNWNFEMFFSMSSSGGNTAFYVELLKYDGTTFTSIASSSVISEEITGGTNIDLYLTSLAIPATTLLATDRLALRVYIVNNSGGRTATLHTQDSHLCQIITNFAGGVSALNGLTANTQYFATGTSGTDFGISSASDTHTFNLPTASATNRGALSSADWTTFNNKVPTSRTLTINGTTQDLSADRTFTIATANIYNADGTLTGNRVVTMGAFSLSFEKDISINGITIGRGLGNISTNFAIGNSALAANTTGNNNFAIGFGALLQSTTGANNIAIGSLALRNATNPTDSIAIGSNALLSSSGAGNIGIGTSVLSAAATGNINIGIGTLALNVCTSGNNNLALGSQSLIGNTTGAFNIAVGNYALGSNIGSSNSTAVGWASMYVSTGANNTALGFNSGRYAGAATTSNVTSNNSLYLGYQTRASANGNTNEIVIGYDALGIGSNTTMIGNSSTITTAIRGRLILGGTTDSGLYQLDVNGTARVSGEANIQGLTAGTGNSSPLTNVNTAFGYQAGFSNTSGAGVYANSFFGHSAGRLVSTGYGNNFFGYIAGATITTGTYNLAIGMAAMYSASANVNNNVGLGYSALGQTTGSGNVAIGSDSGRASGSSNVYIGFQSGYLTATGSNNIAIGRVSGQYTGDNKLYIAGSPNAYGNLIYGDFSTGQLKINDTNTPSLTASAQFEVVSTTRGFLPPRMTTTQKNAIATPAAGLMVYDTTLNKLCVYTTAWETITSL